MSESWVPEFRCCWCSSQFERRAYGHLTAWVCPRDECRERQEHWRIDDVNGHLFYLPNPRQVEVEEAVASRAFTALCFGGARGGSKSVCWRRIAQRYCLTLPNFTVLFLRREYKPLIRNHLRFAKREADLLGADYKEAKLKMIFPKTESELEYGHCATKNDWNQFIGSEADLIVFEQLEQFEEQQFNEIGASAGRVAREDWRGLIGASENPNGPLSAFVDHTFVKKDLDREKFPDYNPSDYGFIMSHMSDNPYISPQYVANLARMSAEKREMYRWGNREVFEGQFFKTFDPNVHVVSL